MNFFKNFDVNSVIQIFIGAVVLAGVYVAKAKKIVEKAYYVYTGLGGVKASGETETETSGEAMTKTANEKKE